MNFKSYETTKIPTKVGAFLQNLIFKTFLQCATVTSMWCAYVWTARNTHHWAQIICFEFLQEMQKFILGVFARWEEQIYLVHLLSRKCPIEILKIGFKSKFFLKFDHLNVMITGPIDSCDQAKVIWNMVECTVNQPMSLRTYQIWSKTLVSVWQNCPQIKQWRTRQFFECAIVFNADSKAVKLFHSRFPDGL